VAVFHQMSPHHEAEHYTDELDRVGGERRPGKLPVGAGGGTYLRPKDSNAMVGVRNRATGKALEGADRQTDRLSAHYSKIMQVSALL